MAGSLRQALSARLSSPSAYPAGRFEGRGIVICAGGQRYFTCAFVLIAVLRRVYGVEWPIQVWHLGQCEMSEEMRLILDDFQVEVVDAEEMVARFPARISGGWPLKPYAIQNSRFREVLYLDADTIPLVDPRRVFDFALYRDNGLVMWPDIADLKAASPIWGEVGLEPRDCISVEAGILLVDKARAWNVIDLSVLLNEHVEEIYSAIYGDKDTFLVAALLLGRAPVLVPHRPFAFDQDLVQRDPDGNPLLQHRTGSKWNLSGPNRPLAAAELAPHCENALAVLRERWSGVVFNAPPRTQKALSEEKRFIAARSFHYEPQGTGGRRLELLPAGRVGEGRGVFEQHWAVVERDGTLILQFYSTMRLTLELFRREDGSWTGGFVSSFGASGGFHARLIDEAAHGTWPYGEGRVTKTAAEWTAALLEPSLFAAGFDTERMNGLRAALSLLNDRFDDVPEQADARLSAMPMPERWRHALSEMSAALASARDERLALAARADYPQLFDQQYYDRVP